MAGRLIFPILPGSFWFRGTLLLDRLVLDRGTWCLSRLGAFCGISGYGLDLNHSTMHDAVVHTVTSACGCLAGWRNGVRNGCIGVSVTRWSALGLDGFLCDFLRCGRWA